MKGQADHDNDVATVVSGTPTANDQSGLTYGEFMKQQKADNDAKPEVKMEVRSMTHEGKDTRYVTVAGPSELHLGRYLHPDGTDTHEVNSTWMATRKVCREAIRTFAMAHPEYYVVGGLH